MGNPRFTAVRAAQRVLFEGGYSDLVFASEIARAELSARDKNLAGAIFWGVLERKITLEHHLSPFLKEPEKLSPFVRCVLWAGAFQILYLRKIPPSAAVNESVALVKGSKERHRAGLVNAVLRNLIRRGPAELPQGDDPAAMALRHSCGESIVRELVRDRGAEFAERYLAASFGPAPALIRVNTLKTSAEALSARFEERGITARPHEFLPDALVLEGAGNVPELPGFAEGLFHVQGAASQLVCHLLSPRAGQLILDACAAPGGKTATLAELAEDKARIVARDRLPARVRLINALTDRLGLHSVVTQALDACAAEGEEEIYDRVLCDVPCSALGILRKRPEIRYKLVTNLDNLPDLQYRILCVSARKVKRGGLLAYSTCTVRKAENEEIVRRFLREHPDFVPAEPAFPVALPAAGEGGHILTLFPHIHNTDGFFIAVLRRI